MEKTQEQIEAITRCEGFTPEEFAVFDIPDFAGRMGRLRERIKPKLVRLGEALHPLLSEVLEETVYPHVAQHLRRTVNPPIETWAAFARTPRAYKPVVHLRAAIGCERMRVTVFVEDYADDKLRFAHNLERNAEALAAYLLHHPTIHAYDIRDRDDKPLHGSALDAEVLRAFAARLRRLKGQHAVFGIAFAPTHPVVASGPELVDAVVGAAHTLKPLYDCGRTDEHLFTYTSEAVPAL